MLIALEGIAICFIVLLVCVIAIADGPVGAVFFYEPEVQARVVELGLTTKQRIKRRKAIAGIALLLPMFVGVPVVVYAVNGARGFLDIFVQSTAVMLIEGLFDRLFIDWWWVGRTRAWLIPGTEDLMPYVPRKTMVRKWIGTLIGYPLLAALMAWVLCLCVG